MRVFALTTVCLLCSAGFAQAPPPSGPPQPQAAGLNQPFRGQLGVATTQRSRVRGFNAGPDGQVRSIYLTNGSVVDLSGFGPGVGAQIRKGEHVRVVGTRTSVNGQKVLLAQQLTVGQQSFTAQPGVAVQAGLSPAPAGGPGMPPPLPSGRDGARRGPHGPAVADMMPPPPPPAGGPGAPPPPPRAGGPGAPPPPPPPAGGPGAPPAGRPGVPPPPPNGNPQGPAGQVNQPRQPGAIAPPPAPGIAPDPNANPAGATGMQPAPAPQNP